MTERRILEVYAGADVRQPDLNNAMDAIVTGEGFYVVTFLERDGEYVLWSVVLVGCSVSLEAALDLAVMEAKEQPEFDEIRFRGLETASVRAEVHTDDHAFEYDFDAAPWFEQATIEQIIALANCGWGGDYPADVVAHWMADYDERLQLLFSYLEIAAKTEAVGFECHIDDGDAGRWLAEHRPRLLATIEGV